MTQGEQISTEKIVRALANAREPINLASDCILCNAFISPGLEDISHVESCPYRMAQTWVRIHGRTLR